MNIVLVDDHAVVRQGYASLLRTVLPTVQVREAASGEEALARVQEQVPNLVIMDFGLPGISGLETTRRLRQRLPQLRVLFFSMHDELPLVRQALDAGASGYLTKNSAPEVLIEAVQRVFSWAGQPLLVDAENWMAHRGAAHVMMNIFRHSRTPGNYVILSGDVHYSFVYQVLIRHRNGGPNIWQITSSGIKNEFPPRLLEWFDRLNRWLYSPRSPLNWFTRRRTMQVVPYIPEHAEAGERLWNSAGIGQVFFNEQGQPQAIYQHNADGRPRTKMMAPEK